MKNAPKIAALLCTALLACAGSVSAQTVPGWPDYLAMGAIGGPNAGPPTMNSTGDSDDFGGKPVDVVFKYAGINGDGDPGVIDPPMNALRMTEDLTALSAINGRAMRVAIVEYTAQMSNGPSTVDFTNTSSPAPVSGATYMMARHFASLGADAMALNDKPVVYNSTNYYGTLILNPDLLGAIQQQSYLSTVNTALASNPVNTAVDQALCFLTTQRIYSYNGNPYAGTPVSILEQLITVGSYPKWQISDKSDPYWGTGLNNRINDNGAYSQVGTWFNSCVASPTYDSGTYQRPNFANTFEGWVQANNWLIRTFSPKGNVTFGWQDNMWAVNSGYWVHGDLTDGQIASTYSTPLSDWLQANAPSSITTGTLGAAYAPDYFVFDRYETDDSDTARGGVPSATLYSARSWDNYVKAVGQVSANFGNLPMMLWQIPGAHISNNTEANPEHLPGGNASQYVFGTAPVYFFGDSNLTANLSNIIAGGNMADPSVAVGDYRLCAAYPSYGCANTTTYKQWLLTDNFNWSQDNGKREMAVANNVFAILWGGGSTTNVIKNFNNPDDHGWLAGKLITYYQNPTPVGAPLTPAPMVSTVSPASGSSGGNTTVTITGTDLTDATAVKFGSTSGTITANSATSITVKSPAHDAGAVDVSVTTPGGTGSKSGAFTYIDMPTVTSISPASGPLAGNITVTITGTNLAGATAVRFGSAEATNVNPVNSTTVTANTTAHAAGLVTVAVTTPDGIGSKSNAFTYVDGPTVTAINPNQGPAGTLVSIVGTNLKGVTGVKFGSAAATSFSVSDSKHATVTAPPHSAGTITMTFTTPGGTSAGGTASKFTYTATPALTTIAKFSGGTKDGAKPVGGLVADSSGNLYGTTSQGGKNNLGTIFRLVPSGGSYTKAVLFHFDAAHGATPFAGLVVDSSKNLYGVTTAGGNKNKGVVFKYTNSTKKLSVLYNFQGTTADGGVPYATLARDSAGLLYGATTEGGKNNRGTTFTFKEPSTFKVTRHFAGGSDGDNPQGAILLDSSKNVYGTTIEGGSPKAGTVYKIAPNGTRTILHTFAASHDGRQPRGGMFMVGSMLFGTASNGGASNKGVVFEIMPPSTAAPILFSFNGSNGANPYAGVVGDSATILYGTTFSGGSKNRGTVFKLVPPANGQTAWSQSVMYSFQGGASDGASPAAPVLLRSNRTLYGTTNGGGSTACSGGCGTVFKLKY